MTDKKPKDKLQSLVDEQKERIRVEEFVEELPVDLTDADRLRIGWQLGETLETAQSVEDSKKAAVADFAKRLEDLRGLVNRLHKLLRCGYERRDVKCTREIDYKAGLVTERRNDTGDLLRQRPLKPSEMQMEIPATESKGLHVVEGEAEDGT